MKNLILTIILLFNCNLFSQDAGVNPLSAISKDVWNVNNKYQNGNMNKLFSGNIYYGVNVVTFNFSTFQTVTFNTNSPESLNIKANYSTRIFAGGLGPDGYIYAVDNGAPGLFGDELMVKIDTASGNVVHTVGPIVSFGQESFTELAFDFDNNIMYASSFGVINSVLRSTLYTVNLNTAQAQVIGQIANAQAIISIAFDNDGRMYGIDIAPPDALVMINTLTGNATQVGLLDFDANYASAMIFSDNDDLYFATINNGTPNLDSELRKLNKNDGSTISTNYFPEISQITVLANPATLTSIISGNEIIPGSFFLYQNYPNPFNPSTSIRFNLNRSGFVNLKIYDIAGKEIKTLISEGMNEGEYEYQFDAAGLGSGVYYYTLSDGVQSEVKKMVLLR